MTAEARPTVAHLIAEPAMTVGMNQQVHEVLAAMKRRGVRFAAVDQGGRITAVLDRRTLNRRLAAVRRVLRVRDVVVSGMACLRADAPAEAAVRLMRITGSAAVPVVDEHHHFIGLVTSDAVAAVDPPSN